MKRFILFLLPLLIGTSIAVALWNYLWLPFSNPLHIISAVTEAGYNPANNSLRFVVLLLMPLVCLAGMYLFRRADIVAVHASKEVSVVPKSSRRTMLIIAVVAILSSILSPTFIASGEFDSFHEGESLAPAVSYAAGQVPYRDMVFIHGAYQDPVRSVVAFTLFGRSIGAVRTWESIVKMVTWLLLGGFLVQLFRGQSHRAVGVMILLGGFSSIGGMILLPRDVLTLVLMNILAVVAYELREETFRPRIIASSACMLGLLPFLGMGFSVDRGVYYAVVSVLTLPTLYYYFIRNKGITLLYAGSVVAGSILGILLLGVLLRWNYSGFLTFCFVHVPQYKELMDSYIFPIATLRLSASVFLATVLVYYTGWRYMLHVAGNGWGAMREYLRMHFLELSMLLIGLLLMRNVLGRADMVHVKYSWFVLLILVIYYTFRLFSKQMTQYFSLRVVQVLVLGSVAAYSGYAGYRTIRGHLWEENFPLGRSDDYYIPEQDKATVEYLKKTVQKDEEFLTLTGEGVWYYYLGKPCPVRFNIIQFAMTPEFQKEVLHDLEHKNIKYILYSNSHWANRIDGFTNLQRLPEIMKYIHEHYHHSKTIDHNQIWVRNTLLACN